MLSYLLRATLFERAKNLFKIRGSYSSVCKTSATLELNSFFLTGAPLFCLFINKKEGREKPDSPLHKGLHAPIPPPPALGRRGAKHKQARSTAKQDKILLA